MQPWSAPITEGIPDLSCLVRPGDTVVWGQGAGEPMTLTEALVAQRAAIGTARVFVGATFTHTLAPGAVAPLSVTSFGAVGTLRRLRAAGELDVVPCHSGQIHRYIAAGDLPCDVAFVLLGPAGPDGRHSFGVTCDYMPAVLARARVVVAEINDQVPWTFGDAAVDTTRIDHAIHTSRPLPQLGRAMPGPVEQAIARNVAGFIGDGATLQLGIGAIPDAVAAALRDRRDMGLHMPMLGDAALDLIECGAATNARKAVDAGVTVAGLLAGTDRLYRHAHRNPAMAVRSSARVSEAAVLAALPGLVTVNSAIEVDLTGQVNAEAAAGRLIGAVGGQADFVRAGHRSPGGRSIIALPSTTADGRTGRIVARLSGPVTTARSDADVIVTEHGVAELRGQDLRERARRMAAIAHPAFRDELYAVLAGLDY